MLKTRDSNFSYPPEFVYLCLSVCLSVCLCVCEFVYLSVCPCVVHVGETWSCGETYWEENTDWGRRWSRLR